jgi:integrase
MSTHLPRARTRHSNRGLRKICGCPRRTWAKCPHSWHFNFKPKGGPGYRFSVDSEAGEHIASKTEAEGLADGWRSAIRAGTFRRRRSEAVEASPVITETLDALTLQAFIGKYLERSAKPVSENDRGCLRRFSAFVVDGRPLGETALVIFTEDTIEAFFAALRTEGRAASTRNKYVQAIKAMFRWAAKKGYLARNPLADSESVKREKHAKRDRRLEPHEEARLLEYAAPHLQRVIVAAIETCCRRGELLALQWRDVNLTRREILIRAEEEGARKTGEGRRLPISARLAAVLEMAQTAILTTLQSGPAAGLNEVDTAALLARCYVFGDAAGLKVGSVKRAWETAVLKAHGHAPQWTKSKKLAAESRAALDAIDLHFHDLRHEGGSRLLEAGWPLHHVQHMLGHANLSQTSTYLNATRIGLQESMRRFDDLRCAAVDSEAACEVQLAGGADASAPTKPLLN